MGREGQQLEKQPEEGPLHALLQPRGRVPKVQVYVSVGEKGWWDAIGLCKQLGRRMESVPPMEHGRCEKGVAAPRSRVPQSGRRAVEVPPVWLVEGGGG